VCLDIAPPIGSAAFQAARRLTVPARDKFGTNSLDRRTQQEDGQATARNRNMPWDPPATCRPWWHVRLNALYTLSALRTRCSARRANFS
jgi:hypothetical protein